jgi:hypothetical protein
MSTSTLTIYCGLNLPKIRRENRDYKITPYDALLSSYDTVIENLNQLSDYFYYSNTMNENS